MSLANFKQVYSNAYQEIFQKVLVAKKIANMRFQSGLKFGESVTRAIVDISNVRVRNVTILSDRNIDSISDSEELLTINYHKGTSFPLSTKEIIQAGPLNPMAYVGAKVAHKTATAVDADVLYEVTNATYDFDNGDLTTLSSTGTPITLSSTTVPQMVSRMPAKLRRQNQVLSNMVFVVDAYAASDITQYLMGKQIDNSLSVFKNGYAGPISSGADLYVSENLTGEAVLSLATTPSDGDTVVIGGVTFTFRTTLGSTAGSVLISGSADAARANLVTLINAPDTTTTYGVALSSANQIIIEDTLQLTATNDNTANTATIVGRGSGRLVLSETFTDVTDSWSSNFIHCYFGKKGAIDLVMQDEIDMEMREEPRQRTTNIFSDALYGIKTFSDGAAQFLDVLISA